MWLESTSRSLNCGFVRVRATSMETHCARRGGPAVSLRTLEALPVTFAP